MSQQVWLGLAGDLVSPDDTVDYYSTRVGGVAVIPGTTTPAEALAACRCSVCGRQLSLLLQAYAPHPDVPDRVLLVSGCTKLGCGKEAGCWKALRCQLPARQQQQQQATAHATAALQPSANEKSIDLTPASTSGFDAFTTAADDWGNVGDWGATAVVNTETASAAGAATPNAFDFSDLTMSLEAASQQQHQAAAGAKQKTKQHEAAAPITDAADCAPAVCCKVAAGAQLPEFYIYSELEPGEAASKALNSKELQHVQQLLAAYEAESATAGASSSSSSNGPVQAAGSSSRAQAAAAASADGDGDEGSWVGEGYEKDELRGVERSYLKFSKRLARQPQQCARYSLNGPLLWPKAQQPQPNKCQLCGGPRVFELQLMPALIQLTIEAAQMALELGMQVDAAVVDAVANWDWATVAVFTCKASCSQQFTAGSCQASLEEVFLMNEQDCHTALPPPAPAGAAATATTAFSAATATICVANQQDWKEGEDRTEEDTDDIAEQHAEGKGI